MIVTKGSNIRGDNREILFTFCSSEKWRVSETAACADGANLCSLPGEVACQPYSCNKLDIPDFIKTVHVGNCHCTLF